MGKCKTVAIEMPPITRREIKKDPTWLEDIIEEIALKEFPNTDSTINVEVHSKTVGPRKNPEARMLTLRMCPMRKVDIKHPFW